MTPATPSRKSSPTPDTRDPPDDPALLAACEVEHLFRRERDGRGDWITSLIPTPWTEILYLLETRGPDA